MAKAQSVFNSAELRQWIIELLGGKTKVSKRALFAECLKRFDLTSEERKDKSSDGKLVKTKSFIGSVLSEMLREGIVETVGEYDYKLAGDVSPRELITEEKIEKFFVALIQKEALTKKTMYARCEKEFDKNGDGAERAIIHRRGGNVIAKLVKNGIFTKDGGKYVWSGGSRFPNTELGACLKAVSEGADVYKGFKTALNLKGGEFFEQYSINLIKKELSRSASITKSEVTGGTDDNGIDGVIECVDGLGFSERVLVQAKTRSKGTITLKEVREFFGSVISENGSRGIFITTTAFHGEAVKFLSKRNNIVGIDGKNLCRLAAKNGYGLKNTADGIEIDYNMFLENEQA